ncbi:NTP transferase domain-containing protein [Marinifilum sp. N1E240]|uniref:molybdenum cofactor guanylyltransferase n=1 Tax=Marinifilum sp. N1E240 TaxID=2608082 RepID=UPI00128B50B1|nr:molybdenum cofactor guanylyltransferase [Marinifilum sp. N1E240]MPQ47892.1 NTP transferase domain-containing protein [Marinifilum sp. N1E240]
MIKEKKIVGIILSGGKSSRMGTEKGLVAWNGKPLIEYSLECIRGICDQIVISSNKNCYNYLNLPVINDEIKECGPIGGIYSCMKKIKADLYLVISCDVPNVPTQLFTDMIGDIEDADLICPIDDSNRKQPLISVYSANCLSILTSELMDGNYKMMRLLDLLKVKLFQISPNLDYYNSKLLSNANSPDDVASL